MSDITLQTIKEAVSDADLVLVGIGDGMQVKLKDLMEDSVFAAKWKEINSIEEYEWIIPFLIRYYLKLDFHPNLVAAYNTLEMMLKDKNYFLISVSTDDIARKMDFRQERLVFPCGSYEKLQCQDGCEPELYDTEDFNWEQICAYIEGDKDITDLVRPVCPRCGKPLVFNQYGEEHYNENGYLPNWEQYTKWLQGTVNRKLCILELGVGMEFPSVIRWPFEKIASYNLKCKFYRIHDTFYMMPDGLDNRGISVKADPVEFLHK